jgi:hypothetical protein
MAGTLYGLGLSQQMSATGVPLSGAFLYIYEENSSTPASTYSDFSLSTLQTFPIEADSAGRLPQIWVADGSYRARLTTSAGVEVFDEASVTAIGASSQSAGSSGGSSVDATTVFETGDMKFRMYNGTVTGWVRCNGRTIGSSASGATERANADTQTLYEWLWNNFSDSLAAVSTGRGANAAADYSANKTIALIDLRDRAPVGLSDMGATTTGLLGTTAGTASGATTLTIAQANIPNYNLTISGLTGTVKYDIRTDVTAGGAANVVTAVASTGAQTGSGAMTALSGTLASGGSGTAITAATKMPPYVLGSWYIKL